MSDLYLKMKFKSLIIDSIRFAAADWYYVIILGLTLFLIENLDTLPGNPPGIDLYDITFWIIIGFLILMEAGYLYRIIHETINGSTHPPRLNKLHKMFLHGFKEIAVFFIYFSIPIIILGVEAFDFRHYLDPLYVNPHILTYYLIDDIIFFHLVPLITSYQFDLRIIFFSMVILLIMFIYFIYLCALLNMVHNNGTIRSGFDFKGLYQRLIEAGAKNLLAVFLLLALVITILGADFFSGTFEFIPVNIYGWNILDIIIQLLLVPFLLTLSIRLLGLISRPTI